MWDTLYFWRLSFVYASNSRLALYFLTTEEKQYSLLRSQIWGGPSTNCAIRTIWSVSVGIHVENRYNKYFHEKRILPVPFLHSNLMT